jgi:hypothetical protein
MDISNGLNGMEDLVMGDCAQARSGVVGQAECCRQWQQSAQLYGVLDARSAAIASKLDPSQLVAGCRQ